MMEREMSQSFRSVEDLSSPAAIVRALERLVMGLPSGWSMTSLSLDRGRFSMTSEPVLQRTVDACERDVWEAEDRLREAAADARSARDSANAARRNLHRALDDDRIPPVPDVAGFPQPNKAFCTKVEWADRSALLDAQL